VESAHRKYKRKSFYEDWQNIFPRNNWHYFITDFMPGLFCTSYAVLVVKSRKLSRKGIQFKLPGRMANIQNGFRQDAG
jgi:hypothetical protein